MGSGVWGSLLGGGGGQIQVWGAVYSGVTSVASEDTENPVDAIQPNHPRP